MVTVKLMTMDSDHGYVPSYGYCEAFMFPVELVAKYEGNEAIYMLCDEHEGQEVTLDMLTDVQTQTWKSGACNYVERTGKLAVPDGMAVVQKQYVNICTRDDVDRWGWVCR